MDILKLKNIISRFKNHWVGLRANWTWKTELVNSKADQSNCFELNHRKKLNWKERVCTNMRYTQIV